MEMKVILIANWLIYGCLFATFFIKLTDEKERVFCRKIAYGLLMLCALYFSVSLFKEAFLSDNKPVMTFNFFETIFSALILFLMCTKVKEDRIFKRNNDGK